MKSFTLGLFLAHLPLRGAELAFVASETATVYEEGPRTGERGRIYFNIEGINHGRFASFGYVIFDPVNNSDLARIRGKVTGIRIEVTNAPSDFSTSGRVKAWIVASPRITIQEMRFRHGVSPYGIGPQLGRLLPLVGSFDYDQNRDPGEVFIWELTMTETVTTHLFSRLDAGLPIHLAFTPTNDDVAATLAGTDWVSRDTGRSGAPRMIIEFTD